MHKCGIDVVVPTLTAYANRNDGTAVYLLLFAGGGAFYAALALSLAWIFDARVRRLLLAEARRAFAGYLRAKALVFDPETDNAASFAAMIEAHAAAVAVLVEREVSHGRPPFRWRRRPRRRDRPRP